jgi:hypothetical protein
VKPQSAKAKGKLLENWVADQIKAKGLDNKAHRDGASGAGNREKADISTSLLILGRQAMFECKNQKTVKLVEWWKQTEEHCKSGGEPLLITKYDREPLEATKITLYFDTFLDLIKKAKEPPKIDNASRELRWHLERLKQDCKKTIDLLEA